MSDSTGLTPAAAPAVRAASAPQGQAASVPAPRPTALSEVVASSQVADDGGARAVLLLASLLLLLLVVANAWFCDDAFITFRTARNFVEGQGLRWNAGERVQGFTHPLWLLLVSGLLKLAGNILVAGWGASLLCTAGTLFLLVRGAEPRPWPAAALLLALGTSSSFVHYSTSGLENPLAHLLLAAQLAWMSKAPLGRRAVFGATLLLALGAVNRLDSVLLVLPLWLRHLWGSIRRNGPEAARPGVRAAALARRSGLLRRWLPPLCAGVAPLVAWHAFSLVYFGFAFPNTAYAKLGTGLPAAEVVTQGLMYLVSLLTFDGPGALLLAGGLVLTWTAIPTRGRGRDGFGQALALGVLLHLAYLVRVGGDFMAGRMLTSSILASTVLLMRALPSRPVAPLALAAALGGWSLALHASPLHPLAKPEVGMLPSGIGDERAQYLDDTSLLRMTKERLRAPVVPLTHPWAQDGEVASRTGGVVIVDHVGFYGYNAGRGVHVIDPLALTDPLLARLPALYVPNWRVGHFERAVPEGYTRAVLGDVDALTDPGLREYYTRLRRVVSGPLWSGQRWKDIWAFQWGRYDGWVGR